jgi:hypothetical protein
MGTPKAPEGTELILTYRVTLAVLLADSTLWVTGHYPESAQATIGPEVDKALRDLRLPPPGRS